MIFLFALNEASDDINNWPEAVTSIVTVLGLYAIIGFLMWLVLKD